MIAAGAEGRATSARLNLARLCGPRLADSMMALSHRGENRSACDLRPRRATGHFGSDETLIDEQMFGPVCAAICRGVDKLFGGATSAAAAAAAAASPVNVPSFGRPLSRRAHRRLPRAVGVGHDDGKVFRPIQRVDRRELDSDPRLLRPPVAHVLARSAPATTTTTSPRFLTRARDEDHLVSVGGGLDSMGSFIGSSIVLGYVVVERSRPLPLSTRAINRT